MLTSHSTEAEDAKFGIAPSRLVAQRDLDTPVIAPGSWHADAVKDFTERLGRDDFPCLFARRAWNSCSILFLFCGRDEAGGFRDFLAGLTEFTRFVKDTALADRLFSPLVVFFETDVEHVADQHAIGWDALNWVHERDPAPWPSGISRSPDDPDWCFCFNGVQLFVNMSSTAHTVLRSRNLGARLTFVINPRENFDAVASIHTKSGRLVRDRIRSRVAAYNDGAVPEELGFYGEEGNREWKQYQLEEAGLPRPATCPFRAAREDASRPYDLAARRRAAVRIDPAPRPDAGSATDPKSQTGT